MAKKKGTESVATASTRVLRSQTPTTEEAKVEEKAKGKMPVKADAKAKGKMPGKADAKAKGKMPVKADAKAKGKMPMIANDKAKGKKTVASEKLKIGHSGESETARKRKAMSREEDTEASGSQVKKVKTRNKNEMDKGAAGGITRVLRSNSAKKGSEAEKQAVKKYSAKAKTHKRSVEAIMPSAAKGSCSLVDFTHPESTSKKAIRSGTKASSSLVVDFTCPESTSKRATRVATKGQVALQKNVKGKKVQKRNKAEEESESDEDVHSSDMKKKASLTIGSSKPKKRLPAKKEVPLTIGSSKPKGNLSVEPSKRTTRGSGKSKEHADDTTAVASSSKTVPKQVSKAENRRGGDQASTPSRKNPARKGRADAKTK